MISTIGARRSITNKATMALHGLRFRIFNVIDLPFILLTGSDRNHDRITVGELVNHLQTYDKDIAFLSNSSFHSEPLSIIFIL